MKKAIIITSAIEIDNSFPLTYSHVRSCFSTEERLRQTIFTVVNLDCVIDDDTTIFLLDISENYDHLYHMFKYQKNLKLIFIKHEFNEIFEKSRKHPNKSYCETLILRTFMEKYKEELAAYDFFFKLSGRYFIDSSFNLKHFDSGQSGLFFKHPLKFQWQDNWNFSMVDLRSEQGDNFLYQYSSVLFGWSKEFNEDIFYIFRAIEEILSNKSFQHYDSETLLYYFTRQYSEHIYEMPWVVYGWQGVSGNFLRY